MKVIRNLANLTTKRKSSLRRLNGRIAMRTIMAPLLFPVDSYPSMPRSSGFLNVVTALAALVSNTAANAARMAGV